MEHMNKGNRKCQTKQRRKWNLRVGMLGTVSVFAAATVVQLFQPVVADARDFDAEIKNLQKQVDSYNAQAAEKSQQANTLQGQIDALKSQQAAIQKQIDLSSAERSELEQKIKDNEAKLKEYAAALSENLKEQYYNGQTSTLDVLLNSDSVSDYVDRTVRQSAATDNIKRTVGEVNKIKSELEVNKKSVEKKIAQNNSQRQELAENQSEQQDLLTRTRNEQSRFQQLSQSTRNQVAQVQKEQQAAIAAYWAAQEASKNASSNSGHSGGYSSGNSSGGVTPNYGSFMTRNRSGFRACGTAYSGRYPYCGMQDSYVDDYGMYNRECVSYAAWRITVGYGKTIPGYPDPDHPYRKRGSGNATSWPKYSGGRKVSNPQPGDVAIVTSSVIGGVGHAMVVEKVLSDGWVLVSQYNWSGNPATMGMYSTMEIKGSGITYLRF